MREPQRVAEGNGSVSASKKNSPILVKTFKAKYSVIIVSYNCRENLLDCLKSLELYNSEDAEIIVVDNNSKDSTSQLKEIFPKVQWIFNEDNMGYSKACNIGSEVATGEYLVFLNPDTQVTPNWLDNMASHFVHKDVGAVGPLSNYVAGLQKYEAFTQMRIHSPEQIIELSREISQKNKGQGLTTKLLIGFCLMIPRSLFNKMGKMDPNLFLGNDDLDISWRLQEQGLKMVVATDTYIFHEGQKSFKTESSEKVNKLVEESTNALYEKLVRHYGDEAKVPSSREIWGMDWFTPSNKGRIQLNSINDFALHENKSPASWIIYVNSSDLIQSLQSTLDSILLEEEMDVIVCYHGSKHFETDNGQSVTSLNLPAQTESGKALLSAIMLAQQENLIICRAGMVFSSHFHHVLANTKQSPDGIINIPQKSDLESPHVQFDKLCIVGSKTKVMEALGKAKKGKNSLQELINSSEKSRQLPAVLWKNSQEGVEAKPGSTENFAAYPESLRNYLNRYQHTAFTKTGLHNFWTAEGNQTTPQPLECLIYRHSTEDMAQYQEDLKRIKELCPDLKKLLVLWISPSKSGENNSSPSALANSNPIQKAKEGLWNNGYYIHGAESFGLKEKEPSNPAGEVGEGIQIDCEPRSEEYALDKKVSIIILGFNQVGYTKKCIDSIIENTRQKYELILVDNGSQDNTAEYFNSLPDAKVIINRENLGVAKGWNQGLKLATGDYVLIFNNDTIVHPNWLENMVRLAECNPKIGIVGPRSNNISGPQKIEDCPIKTEEDIKDFSTNWQTSNNLSAFEFERITGFCMLISKKAFKDIGFFDERYGKGNFEDDDYCLRARYRGYQLLVANDSFVFHFGSVSYSHQSVDWKNLMSENLKKFQEKWSRGVAALADTQMEDSDMVTSEINFAEEAGAAYHEGDFEKAKAMYLSMVENDPRNFDGLNGLGIISFHLENYADALSFFKRALSLKPDDPDTAQNIIDVLNKGCSAEETEACLNAFITQFPNNKVFGKAVEQSPKMDKNHWQKHIEELIQEKRYHEAIDVLENLIQNQEQLAFCYNSLGIIAYQCSDAQMAWNHFEKSLSFNLFDEDTLVNYCDAGITLGKKGEVLGTLNKVFSYPGKAASLPEPYQIFQQLKLEANEGSWDAEKIIASREKNIAGENLIREGLLEKAENLFQSVLAEDSQNFRSLNNMGLISWYKKDATLAWEFFKKALLINPAYVDALVNGFDACLAIKNIEEFRTILDEALRVEPGCREAVEILHLISEKGENIYQLNNFEEADSSQQKIMDGDQHLKAGNLDEATLSYLDALDLNPQNYKAINGLGVIAYKRKMNPDAHRLFEAAVLLNPLDEDSLLNLWENSKSMNSQKQVIHHLQNALQIDPSLKDIREALDSFSAE